MKTTRGALPWAPLLFSLSIHASLLGGLVHWGRGAVSGHSAAEPDLLAISVLGGTQPGKSPAVKRNQPTVSPQTESPGAVSVSNAADSAATHTGVTPPGATLGGGSSNELSRYALLVREQIGRSLRYPVTLQRRGIQGHVGLKLTLDGQGHVQTQEISEGSGFSELDSLALEAARAAQPYPVPSDALQKAGHLVLNLPIEFKSAR